MVIGIDPGQKGGLALIDTGSLPEIYRPEEIRMVLRMTRSCPVYIEQQSAVSGQAGVAKTMQKYGELIGWIEACGHECNIVPPQVWYRYFKVPARLSVKERKEYTSALMAKEYPDIAGAFFGPRGGLRDGITDALAIATYGLRKEQE